MTAASTSHAGTWQRRARPLLGTLVEVGIQMHEPDCTRDAREPTPSQAHPQALIEAAFAAVARVHALMSRFDAASDIARFNALPCGASIEVDAWTAEVLAAALAFCEGSAGLFDVALGRPHGWQLQGARVIKLEPGVELDLGGIAKGYAVDRAVQALQALGCVGGCVNAGGDLRAFGAAVVPVLLRQTQGGARPFATLAEGAFATSRYEAGGRSFVRCAGRSAAAHPHASVAADRCLWADALTKIVCLSGDTGHPLLAPHRARAWLH